MKYDFTDHMLIKIMKKRNGINDHFSVNMLKGGGNMFCLQVHFMFKDKRIQCILRGQFLSS